MYHIPTLKYLTPDQISWQILEHCHQEGIPEPSEIMYSGRGLYLKWFLKKAIPSQALPRWKTIEATLVNLFSEYGADQGVKDASRVLRMEGSINTKSGELVRIIYPTKDVPLLYDFEYLHKELLPFCREDLNLMRHERSKLHEDREVLKKNIQAVSGGRNTTGLRKLSALQLNWDRLSDLRALAAMRGGVKVGMRDTFLFLATCFSAWVVADLHKEVVALAREFAPGLSQTEVYGYASTAISRTNAARTGKLEIWNGMKVDPRYKFRNQTLIDWLEIQSHEENKMTTIISQDEAAERHRKRNRKFSDRATYLQTSEIRRNEARRLRAKGRSIREIAVELKCSPGAVQNYLKHEK